MYKNAPHRFNTTSISKKIEFCERPGQFWMDLDTGFTAAENYGIINTEEAGTLVFSGVPAFFVTIVLLVQCSVKQKFIVVQPMKTSL